MLVRLFVVVVVVVGGGGGGVVMNPYDLASQIRFWSLPKKRIVRSFISPSVAYQKQIVS